MPILECLDGADRGRTFAVSGTVIKVGRATPHAHLGEWILLNDPTVSAHHATLYWDTRAESLAIEQKSQTNPTLVNDEAIVAKTRLVGGDRIQLGARVLRVVETGTTIRPARKPTLPQIEFHIRPADRRAVGLLSLALLLIGGGTGAVVFWNRQQERAVCAVVARYYQAVAARDSAAIIACLRTPPERRAEGAQRLARFLERSNFKPVVESFQVTSVTLDTANHAQVTVEERSRLVAPAVQTVRHRYDVVKLGDAWLIDPQKSAINPKTVLPEELMAFGPVRGWFATAGPGVLTAYVIASDDAFRRRFAQALVEHERRRHGGAVDP